MMAVADPAPVSHRNPTSSPPLQRLLATIHSVAPDAYLVGGALRDLLSGRQPVDIDIVTTQDAHGTADALAKTLNGHAFELDADRAQWRVVLDDAPASEIDVSTVSHLSRDLAHRDFTVDAMAAPVLEDGALGELIDPTGGLDDLAARRLRMVSVANLEDDPLRLLRAARLAVELEYEVEPETAATVPRLAPELADVAGERQRDELVRILATPRAATGVRLMDSLGLLDVLLPELAPARGVEQPRNHHYYDVFEHSLHTLAALDEMFHEIDTPTGRPWLGSDFRKGMAGFDLDSYLREKTGGYARLVLLKLAGLLHDVSKPETKGVDADGRLRFLGHSEKGSVKAEAICTRLRFGRREAAFVAKLVEEHLRPTQLSQSGLPTSRALYRFFRDLGEAAPACLFLSLADAAAATGPRLQRDRWRGHVAYVYYVLYEGSRVQWPQQEKKNRLADGNDLMTELGVQPGPLLGAILSTLDEAQAVGEISTREAALALARRVMMTPPPAEASFSPPAGSDGEGKGLS